MMRHLFAKLSLLEFPHEGTQTTGEGGEAYETRHSRFYKTRQDSEGQESIQTDSFSLDDEEDCSDPFFQSLDCEPFGPLDYNEESITALDHELDEENHNEFDTTTKEAQLPIYTLSEVLEHDSIDDCWIVLYDKVYDVTRLLHEHPGGEEIILEHAGRDATVAFRSVGHSSDALSSLEEHLIGALPEEQRIFKQDSGWRWSIW